MRRAPINLYYGLVPPRLPLRAHKQRIVQQRVLTAACKQRRRQLLPPQVGKEWRNGRMSSLLHGRTGQKSFDVLDHDFVVDDEVQFMVGDHGQEAGEVEAAVVQEQALEGEARRRLEEMQRY